MKKLLVILLAGVFLCGFAASLADEIYSKPIQFQGVAWGSDYSEVVNAIPDSVRILNPVKLQFFYPVEDMMYKAGGKGNQLKAEIGCYAYAGSGSLKEIKVAGYEVKDLYLYFIYTPDENGKLIRDKEHTALYYAFYRMEPENPDAVYEDLVAQMTALYGDADAEEQDESLMISDKMVLWHGAEGTMISVYRHTAFGGKQEIFVKYGFKGGNDLMNEAYAAFCAENEAAESDADGQ